MIATDDAVVLVKHLHHLCRASRDLPGAELRCLAVGTTIQHPWNLARRLTSQSQPIPVLPRATTHGLDTTALGCAMAEADADELMDRTLAAARAASVHPYLTGWAVLYPSPDHLVRYVEAIDLDGNQYGMQRTPPDTSVLLWCTRGATATRRRSPTFDALRVVLQAITQR